MSAADREKWDARWRERGSPGEPSAFLRSLADRLPRKGRALDVAGGAGRHAVWLAGLGLSVTLVDVSEEGLRLARQAAGDLPLETLALDLEVEPLPPGPFDLIVCFYFLDRRVYAGFAERLRPGGLAVVAHPTIVNLERHSSPSAARLVTPGELPRLLPGLEPLLFEEGWVDGDRHEARFLGVRER